MPVKYTHSDIYSIYYCTFTCYNWLPLIESTKSYDIVYNWFSILTTHNIHIVAYEHSSASFYEDGKAMHFTPKHFRDI